MPKSATPQAPATRRIRTDPLFFAILGTIAATYVVLIVIMLAADATYIFTSDMAEEVVLDFSTDADGEPLRVGDGLDDRFAKYGLTVRSADAKHPARVLDSNKPSAANSDLGTPNQQFGGPGVGAGGVRDSGGENHMPLGNVVIVADTAKLAAVDEAVREFVVNWVEPVRVQSLHVEGDVPLTGKIVTYNADGAVIAERIIDADAAREVAIGDDGVTRMDVTLPEAIQNARVDYTLQAGVAANLNVARRESLQLGNLRIVPQEARQIAPRDVASRLVFAWEDPVHLDEIQLVNVAHSPGRVVTYGLAGEELASYDAADLGANSVQSVRINLDGVARMEVDLPPRAAVAELTFHWMGRVRQSWERDHPAAARIIHNPISSALGKPEIQYSIKLSLIACTMSAILSLWVAIPTGYLLSRHKFFGRNLIDAVLDIPIVLPPLVIGLSLLILFQFAPTWLRESVVYQIPAVILAQFSVACAFAVRTMRATFDQIDARREQVAMTLGCSRFQAFGRVVVPEAGRGILTAGTLAWARALGEFGPLLIFAGTTRMKTEVLSVSVYLELSVGDLGAAVAVSLIMVVAAVIVLILARMWGTRALTL